MQNDVLLNSFLLLLLQDAGLLALVAAANVVPVPDALPIQDYSRSQKPVMLSQTAPTISDKPTVCHPSATVDNAPTQADSTHERSQSLACSLPAVTQEGVKAAVPAAAVLPAAQVLPGKYRQPHAARKRKHKRCDPSTGVTPEHMLYWVSQADIAAQLRCIDTVGPAETGLLSEAASVETLSQQECPSTLQAGSAEEKCIFGWEQISGTANGSSNRSHTVEPASKSLKRRQCL